MSDYITKWLATVPTEWDGTNDGERKFYYRVLNEGEEINWRTDLYYDFLICKWIGTFKFFAPVQKGEYFKRKIYFDE